MDDRLPVLQSVYISPDIKKNDTKIKNATDDIIKSIDSISDTYGDSTTNINNDYNQPILFKNGKDNASYNTKLNKYYKNVDVVGHVEPTSLDAILLPNTTTEISVDIIKRPYTLGFLLDRFKVYDKKDAMDEVIVPTYNKNLVEAIVVRIGYTFLSNLKLMSKDVQFDRVFLEEPDKFSSYLLNSVRLKADNIIYDGTTMDIDDLNLNKLNISVVNTKDWYVSYNVSESITDFEVDFIKSSCELEFEFVYQYSSDRKILIRKTLLIGR